MGVKPEIKFLFIALAAQGKGISGGDRIFIELARRLSKNYPLDAYVWEDGYEMCKRQKLDGKYLNFKLVWVGKFAKLGFIFTYIYRVILGIKLGLTLKLTASDSFSEIYIYSASEFWMDSLPSVILKLRFKDKVKWLAAWYQTAPNPLKGFSEKGHRDNKYILRSFLYWLMQFPIKPLITKFADIIVVNNEDERKQFTKVNKEGRVFVMIGAVDLENIEYWNLKIGNIVKVYDAVFQGRFHPQKGVVELIDIWKIVIAKKPDAKLAMIGDGPLMAVVKAKIRNLKLENNIKLFGFVFDGQEKHKLFLQSKLVVHPAFYDSGGMASAEAMAFGLPCVGFDLKAYESYYPYGMIKVSAGRLDLFAYAIINLLNNESYRLKLGKEAKDMIYSNWSWDIRVQELINLIIKQAS